jgi:hypothetical protein
MKKQVRELDQESNAGTIALTTPDQAAIGKSVVTIAGTSEIDDLRVQHREKFLAVMAEVKRPGDDMRSGEEELP